MSIADKLRSFLTRFLQLDTMSTQFKQEIDLLKTENTALRAEFEALLNQALADQYTQLNQTMLEQYKQLMDQYTQLNQSLTDQYTLLTREYSDALAAMQQAIHEQQQTILDTRLASQWDALSKSLVDVMDSKLAYWYKTVTDESNKDSISSLEKALNIQHQAVTQKIDRYILSQKFQALEEEPQLFSVVVMHYKQPAYWKETVKSVLDQNYPYIEIVFSDDGTPDFPLQDVEEFIRMHKKDNVRNFIVRSNQVNAGTAANCDNALALCRGEYILFLDGDDVLASPDTLSQFVAEFEKLPKSQKVISANCEMCDINLVTESLWFNKERIDAENQESAASQYQRLYGDFFPVPSATAFRKSLFKTVGGFKVPHVRLSQDGYFFIHICRMGEHIHLADFIGAKHRSGGVCSPVEGTLSPNSIAVKEEFLKIAEFEIFPYIDQFPQERQDKLCRIYYENMIGYRLASKNEALGISEPAYSILKNWCHKNDIPWHFNQSTLYFSPTEY